jgi:hypothetical protein
MNHKILLNALAISLLAGCGGDDSDPVSPSIPTKNTGMFVDSAVSNVDYPTETLEGTTNSEGEFEYMTGETVTLSLGNLDFPPVAGIRTITPLTLFGTESLTDPSVINMIRLLQSLDKDGNPDNGITITDAAKLMTENIDFSLSTSNFENSTPVTSLLAHADLDTAISELIDQADALAHLEETLDAIAKFDLTEINDSSFTVRFTDSGSIAYYLNSNGTGVMDDGNGIGSVLSWSINSSGALVITTEDYTDTYTLISGDATTGTLSIHINDKAEGLSDTTGTISKVVGLFTPIEIIGGGVYKVTFTGSADFVIYQLNYNGTGEANYTDGGMDNLTWGINSTGELTQPVL